MELIRICVLLIFIYSNAVKNVECLLNGMSITNGQFAPHIVLFLPNDKVCGGEILSPNHVLTASSCVFNDENELISPEFILVSGRWNVTTKPVVPDILNANVAAIYAHAKYDPYSKENNIAVVRLFIELPLEANSLLPAISKAQPASRIVADETSCTIGGYNENDAPNGLMFVSLPIYNRIDCNQKTELAFQIQDNMICTGAVAETALCESDIGSGLYCNGNLVGILSFGASCVDNSPAVFTQIRMYRRWINDQLLRSDIPRAGPTPPPTTDKSAYFSSHWIPLSLIGVLLNLYLIE